MKVLSRWATVGFAILAVVLGGVIAAVAMAIMIWATKTSISGGTSFAVFYLVFTPVQVVTLMLASRRSGSNVLAYLGLDIPRWQHIAITVVGLAVFTIFFDTLTLALGRDIVGPWMLEIRRSAQAVSGAVNPRIDGEAGAGEDKGAVEAPGLFNGIAIQSDGLSVVSSV